MEQKTFADGVFVDYPKPTAPSFVKFRLNVRADKFITFLADHKNEFGYCNFDVLESKNGKLYITLDTYKSAAPKQETPKEVHNGIEYPQTEINIDDIPF